MSANNVQIEESWKQLLTDDFEAEYFQTLRQFIVEEKKKFTIYPPGKLIFSAFDKTPVSKVKAVILGQDPYHGEGQAHGLCFSVQKEAPPPPSLVNIYKELNSDLQIPVPGHGNLEKWAEQGVFLLNATLTVRASNPRSHFNKGWEKFTGSAVQKLSETRNNLVFMLWGNDAKLKENLIDQSKHLVLKTVHPSPFSVNNGFFGCKHFSKANKYLSDHGISPIDWSL